MEKNKESSDPVEPSRCKACGSSVQMNLLTVEANGQKSLAWCCQECGHAHLPKVRSKKQR